MMEFESSHVGLKKKKLFKLYIAAYDYKNNDKNDSIIFFVVSTKEKSKMAEYNIMIGIRLSFQSFHSGNWTRKKLLMILKQKWITKIRLPIGN